MGIGFVAIAVLIGVVLVAIPRGGPARWLWIGAGAALAVMAVAFSLSDDPDPTGMGDAFELLILMGAAAIFLIAAILRLAFRRPVHTETNPAPRDIKRPILIAAAVAAIVLMVFFFTGFP